MKLHRLEITAFGPYPDRVEIDFDRLDEAGVYLLTGPTGSGKTTVLDAISYALFGEIPRARRGAKVVSDHRERETTPQVILEATIGGQRLRIERTPEHERPRLRGEGVTTQAQSVLVEAQINGEWQLIGNRWTECNQDLTARVGMNADQFCQVVMLPQGEFARFLKADVGSRRELLEKLFPGINLTWMEDWFREKARADSEARTAKLREISDRFEQVRTIATGLGDDDGSLPDGTAAAPALEWIETTENRLADRFKLREDARVAASAAAEKADRELEALGNAVAAIEKKRGAEEERNRLAARSAWREESGREIEAARQASGVRLLTGEAEELAAAEEAARQAAATLEAALGSDPLTGDLDPEELPEAEASFRSQVTTIINFERDDLPGRRKLAARVTQLETELQALAEGGPESPPAQAAAALERAKAEEERAKRHLIEIRDARTRGMAAELALNLKEGEPCTVCGSTKHPSPAHDGGSRVTPEQEDAAQAAADRAAATTAGKAGELSRVEAQVAARKAELETGLATDRKSLAQLETRERELRADAASVGERRDALQRAADLIRDRLAATRTVSEKARAAESAREKARDEASANGFGSVEDALAASRDEASLEKLAKELKKHDDRLAIVRSRLEELAEVDTTREIDLEPARREAVRAGETRDEATGLAGVTGDELRNFRTVTGTIPRLFEELEPLREAAAVSEELKRMTGGHNERRMKLSIYVLATRLQQVIEVANRHLQIMSDQRYELAYTSDLAGHGAASGLGIEVFDAHTSERRPTSSLSGGESFWASLSLALGLAEIVALESGGRTIETLFIDEGFGTLDPDSLGNVIDVIDSLREGGRSVGLVSHVEEMKVRIPAQIQVRGGKQGSTLEVVV